MLHAQSIGTGRVFPNLKPRWFLDAVREAKIEDFKWHDLRHTFASRLVMAGVDIRTVQELMGHKSITMTMRYAHLSPKHRTEALEKLCGSATKTATEHSEANEPVAVNVQ
jgi:integrase